MNRHNLIHTTPQTGRLIIFMTQYTQRNVLNQTNRNMILGKFSQDYNNYAHKVISVNAIEE